MKLHSCANASNERSASGRVRWLFGESGVEARLCAMGGARVLSPTNTRSVQMASEGLSPEVSACEDDLFSRPGITILTWARFEK